jgi:hypothetical protein
MKAVVKIADDTLLKEVQKACFSKGFAWKNGNQYLFTTKFDDETYFILNETVMTWTNKLEIVDTVYKDFQKFKDVKAFIRKVKIDHINEI